MARRPIEHTTAVDEILADVLNGEGPFVSLDERTAALGRLRENGPENAAVIDGMVLEHVSRMRGTIESLGSEHEALREIVGNLTAPPYFPAIYLAPAVTLGLRGAVVQTENDRRIVQLGLDVNADQLLPGDEVLLSHERNCLIANLESPSFLTGEVASYSRSLGDGRMVLSFHDEEIVILPKTSLASTQLKSGDRIRFQRNAGVAFEKIEASKGDEYFMESTPTDTFAEIGGLDEEIETLKRVLTLHVFHGETTARYRLPRKRSVLMEGPPGNGKTKMARAVCNWLAGQSPAGRSRFINVKPGGLNSEWFGATEQRYREIFRVAREMADADPTVPVVMFWDEVDAIGGHRGEWTHHIDDRMLNAFMAELSGLEDRGNMVLLAATNRMDSIDPALLRPGRLGDLVLHFPRPGSKAARAILARYLPSDIPFAANGEGPARARESLLDLAIGQLFAPSRETELADLMLRDGKHRVVRAADLVSGAHLTALAQSAIERACVREAEGGPCGVCPADISAAVVDFCQSAPRALTPRNARNYLYDLPQDVDVVRVDFIGREANQPYRYRVEAA
jgi:proteasome-associated ATPase